MCWVLFWVEKACGSLLLTIGLSNGYMALSFTYKKSNMQLERITSWLELEYSIEISATRREGVFEYWVDFVSQLIKKAKIYWQDRLPTETEFALLYKYCTSGLYNFEDVQAIDLAPSESKESVLLKLSANKPLESARILHWFLTDSFDEINSIWGYGKYKKVHVYEHDTGLVWSLVWQDNVEHEFVSFYPEEKPTKLAEMSFGPDEIFVSLYDHED